MSLQKGYCECPSNPLPPLARYDLELFIFGKLQKTSVFACGGSCKRHKKPDDLYEDDLDMQLDSYATEVDRALSDLLEDKLP